MSQTIERLLYRRQFLFAPRKIEDFPHPDWTDVCVGESNRLYAHPDLPITQVAEGSMRLTLIGYMVDANETFSDDTQILRWILRKVIRENDIFEVTASIGGRWILIVDRPDGFFLFHDPCGLRQVYYYTDAEENIWCCTQTTLLSSFADLKKDDEVSKLLENARHKNWLPGHLSEFVDVKKLLPNHVLNLESGNVSRFWPKKPLGSIDLESGTNKVSLLLKNCISNINHRFDLSLPLTAGRDSRTIFAACKDIIEDVSVYTMLEPGLEPDSLDIEYPKKLTKRAGVKHSLIPGQEPMEPWFADIYFKNVYNTNVSYWGPIAFGFVKGHPENRITLNGNCSEIGRCYYFLDGNYDPQRITGRYLANLAWTDHGLAVKVLNDWLKDAKQIESQFNINALDLFYWEHRMGGWQAKSQSICDIGLEIFSPFNNRLTLSTLLAVDKKYRIEPDFILYNEIINSLWPALLTLPFNRGRRYRVIDAGKGLLKKLGVFQKCKALYSSWTKRPRG